MLAPAPRALRTALAPQALDAPLSDMTEAYLETIQLLERMHRLMVDLVKNEFERLRRTDLTPAQGMMLYHLGEDEVSATELRSRGMYHGSNVSYNLKKLVTMGYIHCERDRLDRRSVRVRLTSEGQAVRAAVRHVFIRHAEGLAMSGVLEDPPHRALLD